MTRPTFFTILKMYLIIGSLIFIADGVFHFLPLRIQGIENHVSPAFYFFISFMTKIWASIIFTLGCMGLIMSRDLKKYQSLIIFLGVFAFYHSILLLYFSFFDWNTLFAETPAIHVWHSYYAEELKIEAGVLLLYSCLVTYGWAKNYLLSHE